MIGISGITNVHKDTLKGMIDIYKLVISDAERIHDRAVACAMIKLFIGNLWRDNEINDDQYSYSRDFDIVSPISSHKAFCDIIERWVNR